MTSAFANIRKRFWGKKRLFPLWGALTGVLVTGVITQLVTGYFVRIDEREYAGRLLRQAEEVATQLSVALRSVSTHAFTPCSEDDINLMREQNWAYNLVQDIGRVSQGKVICTASWGVLKQPASLPDDGYYSAQNNVTFYRQASGLLPVNNRLDVVVKGDTVVFTSPSALKELYLFRPDVDARLTTKNGKYTFQTFKGNTQENSGVNLLLPDDVFYQRICSTRFDICLEMNNTHTGVMSLPVLALLLILLAGGSVGYLAGFSVYARINRLNSMDMRLKKAIFNRELFLEYQPQFRLSDQRIVGAEVLVRWHDVVFGNVSPEFFIRLAERLGVYRNITRFVIEQALHDMSLILASHPDFSLSINVGKHDISDYNFIGFLNEVVDKYAVNRRQIKMEITEKTDVNYKLIAESARELQRQGYCVSLDDFGTGVANIHWLTEIPFDEIKLDKYFVRGLQDTFKIKMLDALLSIIIPLNKIIVFEGIEKAEEKNIIQQMYSAAIGQGWFYSRSLSARALAVLLMEKNVDGVRYLHKKPPE